MELSTSIISKLRKVQIEPFFFFISFDSQGLVTEVRKKLLKLVGWLVS